MRLHVQGREAKAGNLRGWSLSPLAQNCPITLQQFCLSEVNEVLAKFAFGCSFSQIVDDVKFWLLRVRFKSRVYTQREREGGIHG